jgi:putative transposase
LRTGAFTVSGFHHGFRFQGVWINHKKPYRLYREERLSVRKRGGRKRALSTRAPMVVPQDRNLRWSLDFVMDTLTNGRRFRVLTLRDRQRQRHRADLECHSDLAADKRDRWHYIAPDKAMQNGFVESLNGRLREECLNEHMFSGLAEARQIIEAWRIGYNTNRPHTSLNGITPSGFAARPRQGQNWNRLSL